MSKRMLRFVMVLIIPLLFLQLIPTIPLVTELGRSNGQEDFVLQGDIIKSYTSHDPISINGNGNFHATATSEGWSGDGTQSNPYLIEDYSIVEDAGTLIYIQNTNLHFVICRNSLDGGDTGVYNEAAIHLYNVQNAIISYNELVRCSKGVYLRSASNIQIFDNVISNHVFDPTWGDGEGIDSLHGSNIEIYRNTVASNEEGIFVAYTSNIRILANTIRNNLDSGINLMQVSTGVRILSNHIHDNELGIGIEHSSNVIVQSNTIEDNTWRGLALFDYDYNKIKWNNFIGQTVHAELFTSYYHNNVFDHNYFDDWPGTPSYYAIPTDAYDYNPLSSTHTMTQATVTYPNGGEILTGTVDVTWTTATDSHSHGFNYSVACSSDGGAVWTELATGLTGTTYSWDTTQFQDETYEIRVITICSEGVYKEDRSNAVFNVHNTLPSPSILYPNGGESLNETVTVDWVDVVDPFAHDVIYDLYVSDNGGSSWSILTSDLDTSSYEWDTTVFENGDYDLMVNVSCTEGAYSIDVTNASFQILNHILSEPTITYPNGGEMILGVCDVTWTESTDTWGHNVTYSVYYSPDGGSMWFIIILGHEDTTYSWNTTNLVDGNLYMLRVVATCSELLTASDDSDNPFSVHNTMSIPTVLYPNGGETLTNVTVVEWSVVTDSFGHDVTYSVYYSIDDGDWILLADSLVNTSYDWNTTEFPNGHAYEVRVVAECEYGLITEDQSNGQFSLRNSINNIAPTVDVSFTPVTIYIGESLFYHVDVDDLEDDWTNLTMRLCFWRSSTWRNRTVELTAASADYEYITSATLSPNNYDLWIVVYDSDGARMEYFAGNFTLLNNIPQISASLLNTTCYWGEQFQVQVSISDIEHPYFYHYYQICLFSSSGWWNQSFYLSSEDCITLHSTSNLLVREYSIWIKVYDYWGGQNETFAGSLNILNNLPECSLMLLNSTVALNEDFWFYTNVSDVENSLEELDVYICFYKDATSWNNYTINLSEEYEIVHTHAGMLGVGTYDVWIRVIDGHNATVESFGGTIVIEEIVVTTITSTTTSETTTSSITTTTETTTIDTTPTITDSTIPSGGTDFMMVIVLGAGLAAGGVILFLVIWFLRKPGPIASPSPKSGIDLG